MTSGGLRVLEETHFRIERRILGNDDQMIDGIQPETDRVERFVGGGFEWKKHLWLVKLK